MGYLNLVNGFIYKDPVFRAKVDALAENDAYLKANGWLDSTETLFYQSAVPTGWTKDTSVNDKYLRVVALVGGGTGGSKAPSATITLAHAHTITSDANHTHQTTSHYHDVATDGTTVDVTGPQVVGSGSNDIRASTGFPGSTSLNVLKGRTSTTVTSDAGTSSAGTHNHTLNNSLTDTNFQYCDIIIGIKSTSAGYTDLTSTFHSGDIINFDPFSSLAANDAFNLARLMPSSSVMIFGQASAPTGWTKATSINDKALRVVSGTGGGTGGTTALSSGLTLNHTHTMSAAGSHTHSSGAHQHSMDFTNITNGILDNVATHFAAINGSSAMTGTDGTAVSRTIAKGQTDVSGSGVTTSDPGTHTHGIVNSLNNVTLAYVDVIQCSKNSSGASSTYTDMTAVFAWKKLVSYQRLNKMAANDDYILYHSIEPTTLAFFFMATVPAGWTRQTSQDDKALRIVSGSSGGSAGGGLQAVSATVSLAHTHTINAASHNHTYTHAHVFDSRTEANAGADKTIAGHTVYPVVYLNDTSQQMMFTNLVTLNFYSRAKSSFNSKSATTDTYSHDHGTTTPSALTDFTFAYADVLYGQKN